MFRMAARNIKDNTSEPVSEEQIKAVLRRSLDEVLTPLSKTFGTYSSVALVTLSHF